MEVGCIDNADDQVGSPLAFHQSEQDLHHDRLIRGPRIQAVCAGKIQHFDRGCLRPLAKGAASAFDGYAREIRDPMAPTGQRIEHRGLPGVGVADKRYEFWRWPGAAGHDGGVVFDHERIPIADARPYSVESVPRFATSYGGSSGLKVTPMMSWKPAPTATRARPTRTMHGAPGRTMVTDAPLKNPKSARRFDPCWDRWTDVIVADSPGPSAESTGDSVKASTPDTVARATSSGSTET